MSALGELKRIEERLWSGTHWDSILHFTRGEMKPLDPQQTARPLSSAARQRQSEAK